MTTAKRIVRVQNLVGRRVTAQNGKAIGHIEEIVATARGSRYDVTHVLLGSGALIERLGVARLFGRGRELVARWDQLEFGDDGTVRLTCGVGDLEVRDRKHAKGK